MAAHTYFLIGSGACLNGIKEKWEPDGCHSRVGTVTDGLLGIIGVVVGVRKDGLRFASRLLLPAQMLPGKHNQLLFKVV